MQQHLPNCLKDFTLTHVHHPDAIMIKECRGQYEASTALVDNAG